MNRPNLFVVGAARSGTTSLWQYLKTHPQVYFPLEELQKEPGYFSDCGGKSDLQDYLSVFAAASSRHQWIGEASVAYLTDPKSAARIHSFDPASRIIILLRNPIDRAYSLYCWMVQEGYEHVSSFEEALALEESRRLELEPTWLKPNYYWGYLYFESGLYCDQVERYLQLFSSNVMLLSFDALVESPEEVVSRVCSFLGISPHAIAPSRRNRSRDVISSKAVFLLRKLNRFVMTSNQKGVPISRINRALRGQYARLQKRLARAVGINLFEKMAGEMLLERASRLLESDEDQFPYRAIEAKEQRDRLVYLGRTSREPPPLGETIRERLASAYDTELEGLFELTSIDLRKPPGSWMRGEKARS